MAHLLGQVTVDVLERIRIAKGWGISTRNRKQFQGRDLSDSYLLTTLAIALLYLLFKGSRTRKMDGGKHAVISPKRWFSPIVRLFSRGDA